MTVPAPVGVNVTEQLAVVTFTAASVHGLPVKDPLAVPVLMKDTLPVVAFGLPAAEVSFTKAVHVVD